MEVGLEGVHDDRIRVRGKLKDCEPTKWENET